MALTVRKPRNGDRTAVTRLLRANRPDLVADWGEGGVLQYTDAEITAYLQELEMAVGVCIDDIVGLVGIIVVRDRDLLPLRQVVQCMLMVADERATAAQRLAIAKKMAGVAASTYPGNTIIYGVVKAGRRLDVALSPDPIMRRIAPGETFTFAGDTLTLAADETVLWATCADMAGAWA